VRAYAHSLHFEIELTKCGEHGKLSTLDSRVWDTMRDARTSKSMEMRNAACLEIVPKKAKKWRPQGGMISWSIYLIVKEIL
jgi:hypothetical protein